MAIAADRVEPVFGDALAGDGGMTEPAPAARGQESSVDVFPDALSALPLPALTFVVPPGVGADGVPAVPSGMPGLVVSAGRAPTRSPAGRASGRDAAPARSAPPTGPAWSGYPPPGQPFAIQPPPFAAARPGPAPRQPRPVAPATGRAAAAGGALGAGRRSAPGVAYTPPTRTASSVVRPPAYLPQNPGLAGLRAAAQQVRSGGRTPASPPSAIRPTAPTGRGRSNRASSIWALFVFGLIFLVSSGAGQNILDAISRLLNDR